MVIRYFLLVVFMLVCLVRSYCYDVYGNRIPTVDTISMSKGYNFIYESAQVEEYKLLCKCIHEFSQIISVSSQYNVQYSLNANNIVQTFSIAAYPNYVGNITFTCMY